MMPPANPYRAVEKYTAGVSQTPMSATPQPASRTPPVEEVIGDGRKRDEAHAVVVVVQRLPRGLDREARLADTGRTKQGDKSHAAPL